MLSVIRLFSFAWLFATLLSFTTIYALPLSARQNGQSTTVMTVHSTMTPAGPMTETCVITLTPITDQNGNPAVEEVKKCKLTVDPANNGSAGGSGSDASAAPGATSTDSTTDTTESTDTATSTSEVTAATSSATGGGNGAISVNGFTTVTGSSSSVVSSSTAVSTTITSSSSIVTSLAASASGNAALSVNGLTTVATSGVSTVGGSTPAGAAVAATSAADSSASVSAAAADASGSATAAFQLPGKKLSVLPIGLGVFAGISVIALIVVGLVTYERTKYRKAFRQRKLAESGAAMGYGGMAQRS